MTANQDLNRIDGEVFLEAPAPYRMLVASNRHAKKLYGEDYMSLSEVERWWRRNPRAIAVLRSEWGQYLGYFDILPLTKNGAKLVREGKTLERDIPPQLILPPGKMRNASALYFAGIAVKHSDTALSKSRAAKLIGGMALYLEHYYGISSRPILAVAVSPEGERLLRSFGGEIISQANSRRDHHDLYETILSKSLLLLIKSRAERRAELPRMKLDPL